MRFCLAVVVLLVFVERARVITVNRNVKSATRKKASGKGKATAKANKASRAYIEEAGTSDVADMVAMRDMIHANLITTKGVD